MTEQRAAARGRGRPRDAEIDRRIIDAARSLLAEGGYRALAFDAISQMTDIPRSMIYRRWPTRAHLASEIASGGDGAFPVLIDTEGLEAQVLALVHQVFDRYRQPDIGAAAVGVIADTQGDRALQRDLQAKAEADARAAFAAIVARGKAMGRIAAATCPDTLFDLVIGPSLYRALFSMAAAPPDYPERVTRMIIDGLLDRDRA
ncbi:TetR family transcriptional regulator [Rhizorhabdus wittichii DC-6]|jgi:AcrR family transcriptional regulator|nr:TetR family transcriptional regulator [Rhizorhabdus wittichii DC-6]